MPKTIKGISGEFKTETQVPRPGEDVKAQHVELPAQDLLNNEVLLYGMLNTLREEVRGLRAQLAGLVVSTALPTLTLEPSRTYPLPDFIRLARLGGFTGDVQLAVLNLPAGVGAALNPAVLTGSAATAGLTLTTSGALVPGIYDLVVRAEGGGKSAQAVVRTTVLATTAPRSFELSIADSAAIERTRGSSVVLSLDVLRSGGFADNITLDGVNLPAGVTLTPSPNPVTGDAGQQRGAAKVTLAAGTSVPAGSYNITLRGQGGGVTRTATIRLTVSAPATTEGTPDFRLEFTPDPEPLATRNGVTMRIIRSGGFTGPVRVKEQAIHAKTHDLLIGGKPGEALVYGDTVRLTLDGTAYGYIGAGLMAVDAGLDTEDGVGLYANYLTTIEVVGQDPSWPNGALARMASLWGRTGNPVN